MENAKKLPMSTYDITKMYKEAKDKRAQIDILADMNVCSTKEIREELIKGGIPFQTLPRKSRREKFTLDKKPKTLEGFIPVSVEGKPVESSVTCKNEEKAHVSVEDPKIKKSSEKAQKIPESVYKAVEERLALLDELKVKHEQALQRTYAEIAELEEFLAKRKGGESSANELTAGE